MKVESIAECWSILQYFWPALRDNLVFKPILGHFESAAPNKDTTILYSFWFPKTVLNPPVNGKIQGLFITNLYIQVLFKPVRTLVLKQEIFLIFQHFDFYELTFHSRLHWT